MSGEKLLVVEDDESILAGLRLNLEMEGYKVGIARDGQEAVEAVADDPPDLVLLDIMLPELNGFEVLEHIRQADPDIAVLLLSARDGQDDKVLGLGLGADDYITKPFDLGELLARINAALRRARIMRDATPNAITFADITIDLEARRVSRAAAPGSQESAVEFDMTAREYDLLVYLAERPDRVLTRGQILDAVWGSDYEGTARTVDNFIARLRTKIEVNPDRPVVVETVRGVGYRFVTRR